VNASSVNKIADTSEDIICSQGQSMQKAVVNIDPVVRNNSCLPAGQVTSLSIGRGNEWKASTMVIRIEAGESCESPSQKMIMLEERTVNVAQVNNEQNEAEPRETYESKGVETQSQLICGRIEFQTAQSRSTERCSSARPCQTQRTSLGFRRTQTQQREGTV
jgi:hypothetical protein